MPKQKELQLSGAKKRKLAKVKAEKERSTVAKAQRLDRFLVHSKLTETESETVAVATVSSSSTFQDGSENCELEQCQPPETGDHSESVSESEDDQG
jgi:hypothetical protein